MWTFDGGDRNLVHSFKTIYIIHLTTVGAEQHILKTENCLSCRRVSEVSGTGGVALPGKYTSNISKVQAVKGLILGNSLLPWFEYCMDNQKSQACTDRKLDEDALSKYNPISDPCYIKSVWRSTRGMLNIGPFLWSGWSASDSFLCDKIYPSESMLLWWLQRFAGSPSGLRSSPLSSVQRNSPLFDMRFPFPGHTYIQWESPWSSPSISLFGEKTSQASSEVCVKFKSHRGMQGIRTAEKPTWLISWG